MVSGRVRREVSLKSNAYMKSWTTYYQEIQRSIIDAGHPYLLLHFPDLFTSNWIEVINQKFGVELEANVLRSDTKSKLKPVPFELNFEDAVYANARKLYSHLLTSYNKT